MSTPDPWKRYQRKGQILARPHIPGEDLSKISVADIDRERVNQPGNMIAADPSNPDDQWFVNRAYFAKHYEEI